MMAVTCDSGSVPTLGDGIAFDGAPAKIEELLVMLPKIGVACDTVTSPAAPAASVKIDRAIDRVIVLVCRRAMV